MPTIQVKDAGGTTIFLNAASGDGTSGSPYVLQDSIPTGTNSIGTIGLDTGTNSIGSLAAGTAEIGKLGAGTAEIGKLAAGSASIGTLGSNSGVDIGDVDVTSLPALAAGTADVGNVGTKNLTTIATGERQGSASAVQLPTVSCSLVRIKAVNSNAGNVYIGISGVTKPNGTTDTTTGLELDAGEDTGWLPTDNVNRFYIICDNAGDDITYMAMT